MIINPNDFTEKAQAILAKSQEIVRRLKHNQWDAEHLLLALLEEDEGVPTEIFKKLGIRIDELIEETNKILNKFPFFRESIVTAVAATSATSVRTSDILVFLLSKIFATTNKF